jgi:hypothetical protein
MIYELRTYDLKTGTLQKFEAAFAESLEARAKYSPLGAFWRTDIGTLNQVTFVWPYESHQARENTNAAAMKDPSGKWPPKTGEFIVNMASEVLQPAPFMRPLDGKTQQLGTIYEMRVYTYAPGAIPKVVAKWGEVIAEREKFSPLAACWYTEIGSLNRFFHVWAYKDLAERERVRAESTKALAGKWPPQTGETPIKMETKILVPAPFSPLR